MDIPCKQICERRRNIIKYLTNGKIRRLFVQCILSGIGAGQLDIPRHQAFPYQHFAILRETGKFAPEIKIGENHDDGIPFLSNISR